MLRRFPLPAFVLLSLLSFAVLAPGVSARQGYREAPPELARFVDAPTSPSVSVSPDRSTLAVMPGRALPTIADLAQPELRIAGLRINPRTGTASRGTYADGLSLIALGDGSERGVTGFPDGVRIASLAWSPDGRHLAVKVAGDTGVHAWLVEVAAARARPLSERALSDVLGNSWAWEPSGAAVLLKVIPSTRPANPPERPETPASPVIQENLGTAAPVRTYQDMLQNPHDEALLEYHAKGELIRVHLDGRVEPVISASMLSGFEPSPDGRYLLTETVHRPYSYQVPVSGFPTLVEVRDRGGRVVHSVADQPSSETVPTGFGSTVTGPRSVTWRPDRPAALSWVEALDGGDGRAKADVRDALFTQEAPFTGSPVEWARTELRYAGASYAAEGFALVSESWQATRKRRVWRVALDGSGAKTLVFDLSTEDRFGNPGNPMSRPTPEGRSMLLTMDGGRSILLTGEGASPDGVRPFVRKRDLGTGSETELFRSQDPWFESPVALLDPRTGRMLVQRESPENPPNYYVREADGSMRAVTAFPHPYPEMAAVSKEFVTYRRADGVQLSATLYLPAGYDRERDGPLPTFVWAYPREFKSADLAGQVAESPYRFTRISPSGAVPFVTRGYAVLDNAAMPIVGEGEVEPNDSFVEQLVANAEAAIAEGVRRGVVDPERVGVGGHSYGAFMTANLLAHSDLFRAGIARSGAYNRTLTPFGFQSEERTYWEAPEVYSTMSPFTFADRIKEPILLLHGEADNNSGTFPIQSERFYAALKGHGATVRFTLLPHESHGYAARESVGHMLWEMSTWLDTHVRDAPPRDGSVGVKKPTG